MKRLKKECDLQSCFLCRHSLREWLPVLELNRKTFAVARGEKLFSEGEPVSGVFFLESGKAKVHQRWTDDKELIVRIAGPGAIVGHRGLGSNLVYPVSATALEPSTVCFVALDFFNTTLRLNADLTFRLLMFFAEELRESEQRMRNLARLPVKSRVASALLTIEQRFGHTETGNLALSMSRQDLAAYVGATYETVFRMLQELAVAGLVELDGKDIRLSDIPGLAEIAAGD